MIQNLNFYFSNNLTKFLMKAKHSSYFINFKNEQHSGLGSSIFIIQFYNPTFNDLDSCLNFETTPTMLLYTSDCF